MKKLILIAGAALCAVALVLVTVGVTIAWFTDMKESTNVFTAGDVTIKFTELNPEGEIVDVNSSHIQMDYGHVYPGREIVKQSTVTNTGSELAYIAAEIVILDDERDINAALGIPGVPGRVTPLDEFFFGGLWGDSYTRVEVPSAPHFVEWESEHHIIQYDTRMTDGFWINIFVKDTLASGNSVSLWEGFRFPTYWTNDEMLECTNLRISVRIFAVQAAGFENCPEAITTAFSGNFGYQ